MSLNKNLSMTLEQELLLAGMTVMATIVTGNLVLDLVVGIATYTLARLFYYYHGAQIKGIINRVLSKFKKKKK